MIVFKEFPARYRSALDCLIDHGFTRIPSLPMTRLCINYESFEDYTKRALNSATRKKLRKNAKGLPPKINISQAKNPEK